MLIASSGSNCAAETVLTNASIPEPKFRLQRYQNYVGEWPKEWVDRHVIVQICHSAAWAERRGANGNWIRYLKERGSLTIVPAGQVPDVPAYHSPFL